MFLFEEADFLAAALVSKTAYERMGTQWASTMVACIALVLGLLPFVLKWRGAEIRARSPATIAIAREKEEREQARAKGVA